MKTSSFVFIKHLLANSERARNFAAEIKLMSVVIQKTKTFAASIKGNPRTELTKRNGMQQVKLINNSSHKKFHIFLYFAVDAVNQKLLYISESC